MLYYLFGKEIAHFLWYYVLTPGNLIVALIGLFAPFITKMYILPYIYHPYRYGQIPFQPPSYTERMVTYYMIIIGILTIFYVFSGYMNSIKVCKQSDYSLVIYNFKKFGLFLIICLLLLIIFPLVKIPILTNFMMIPYANEFVNGIFWSMLAFTGAVWANRDTVYKLCGK